MEGKTEIIVILNRYKNTFEDFVDNQDIGPQNIPRPVDKEQCNIMPSSENSSTKSKLDKNILDGS